MVCVLECCSGLGLLLGLWQWWAADKRELLAIRDAAPTVVEPIQTPEGGACASTWRLS